MWLALALPPKGGVGAAQLCDSVLVPIPTPRCPPASECCPGCSSSTTRTSWPTPAGRCPTSPMGPMTRSRRLSTRGCAGGWWSCSCEGVVASPAHPGPLRVARPLNASSLGLQAPGLQGGVTGAKSCWEHRYRR